MLDQLDDAIRSALSDIAATAPSIDDVHFEPPVSGNARATWLLPAVAAAIVVLVVGLVAVGTRDRTCLLYTSPSPRDS